MPDEGWEYYTLQFTYNMQPRDYAPVNSLKPLLIVLSIAGIIAVIRVRTFSKTVVLGTSIAFAVFVLWHWVYFLWYCRTFLGNNITGVPLAHSFLLINSIVGLLLVKSGKLKSHAEIMEEIESESETL
jgi:hypothetical protein